RRPPNTLLSHTPACRRVGTKRVKGSAPNGRPTRGKPRPEGVTFPLHNHGSGIHYADPDGKEEVESWDCSPDCPIRLLDVQAGERKSGKMTAGTERSTSGGYHGNMPRIISADTYGDSGNASR